MVKTFELKVCRHSILGVYTRENSREKKGRGCLLKGSILLVYQEIWQSLHIYSASTQVNDCLSTVNYSLKLTEDCLKTK